MNAEAEENLIFYSSLYDKTFNIIDKDVIL